MATKGKPSAFEKRVKRRISGRNHTFFASCPPGLAQLCQRELTALPGRLANFLSGPPEINDIKSVPGGVEFSTRLETACLANLFLGMPVRLLMRMAWFKADNFSLLEKHIKSIDWELYLPRGCDLEIRVTTHKSRLYHSDAIADRFRPLILSRLTGTAPAEESPQTLMVRADNDRFELSLDMSGIPLFKRGIKQKIIQAPLRENLAFAILSKLKLSHDDILVDPMCGSGTFSLEGAMIQTGLPPGFFRSFAFEAWPGFKEKAFAHARGKIQDKLSEQTGSTTCHPSIFASDTDHTAVKNMINTPRVHPAFDRIVATCTDFFDIIPPTTDAGVVVLNPPYGLRLGKDLDIDRFYKEIGKKLATDFKGWRAGIIYPEKKLGKALNLNLPPMPLFHGGIDLFVGLGVIP